MRAVSTSSLRDSAVRAFSDSATDACSCFRLASSSRVAWIFSLSAFSFFPSSRFSRFSARKPAIDFRSPTADSVPRGE